MSSTTGTLFRVTTFGESHSRALGAVIDGCPAGVNLTEKDVEAYIKKASPFFGFSTARREENRVEILSGVYRSRTIGTPISLVTYNTRADSSEYLKLEGVARPSHAEFAYFSKYGAYDPRGGGRASGRECVARHMAAAVAEKLLKRAGIKIACKIVELAGLPAGTKKEMELAVKRADAIKAQKDSSGGVFELTITGVPAGLGSPVFNKLTSAISSCVFSVGGVRAVEIGEGIRLAGLTGSEANDRMSYRADGSIDFGENLGGGISGGISTGAPVVVRAWVRPTPSIGKRQPTINFYEGKNCEVELAGRFDANFAPRAMAAAASTLRIMLADALLMKNF